jgi:ABC-type branched-subunit amino acid transport system substrate-binding protein
MQSKHHQPRRGLLASVIVAALIAGVAVIGTADSAGAQVRGFDGKTITVAGLGIKSQMPLAETGAQARIKRFNEKHEIKGVKIKFEEMVDDKLDTATALSESRRLVTQEGIFALVPDISPVTPGEYLTQQKVPWFGGGFDLTFCSDKPSTKLWGFSTGGCITPANPSFIADNYHTMYDYVSKKSGKKHPTMVIFANDNTSAKNGNRVFAKAATGAGFVVTDVQNDMPSDASDFTPYAQQILTGDHGKAPDSVFCADGVECLNVYELLQAQGYPGVYGSGLYSDLLVKPLDGSLINFQTQNFSSDTPGMNQIKKDMDAVDPGSGAKLDSGAIYGYTSTDMFITALKLAAKKGKSNITPENVQKAASTMTWKIDGVQGPIQYPKSTVMGYPACFNNFLSDGTAWQTVEPYSCSTKTYSPKIKVGG